MKLYADRTGRRTAQILSDVGVAGWVGPARQLEGAGTRFGTTMTDAGRTLRRVPLVGDDLQQPFDNAAATGADIAGAGQQLGEAVQHLALVLGLLVAVLPVVLVVGVWLLLRVRFARRATAAQRFIDADADLDLFALRALARQPMHRLARISDDPAGAWRTKDAQVVRALAMLELRDSGLHPPVETSTST